MWSDAPAVDVVPKVRSGFEVWVQGSGFKGCGLVLKFGLGFSVEGGGVRVTETGFALSVRCRVGRVCPPCVLPRWFLASGAVGWSSFFLFLITLKP